MAEKRISDDLEIVVNNGAMFKLKELRRFLAKEGKIKPSDLFDRYDLLEDPAIKEAIEEGVGFELEYRDKQADEELNEEMRKEIDNEEDFDLGIPGQQPSSEPQSKKEQEKKQEPLESDADDLLPAGNSEPGNKGSSGDQGEDKNPLLPG